VTAFKHGLAQGMSEQEMAVELGEARSTLKYWLRRKDNIDADPALVAFFETEVGIAWLP
jgi:transcriptional regulator with XRE-family HTH domain